MLTIITRIRMKIIQLDMVLVISSQLLESGFSGLGLGICLNLGLMRMIRRKRITSLARFPNLATKGMASVLVQLKACCKLVSAPSGGNKRIISSAINLPPASPVLPAYSPSLRHSISDTASTRRPTLSQFIPASSL